MTLRAEERVENEPAENDVPVCTSSCAFAKVADDLAVVGQLFGRKKKEDENAAEGHAHQEQQEKLGKYSKRIIALLVTILAASILLGGEFIKIMDDDQLESSSRLAGDMVSVDEVDLKSQQRMCANMKELDVNVDKMVLDGNSSPPWYVSIWMRNNTQFNFNCGGTLVGNSRGNWIISSAHCFIPDLEYLEQHGNRTGQFIKLTPLIDRMVLFGDQAVYDTTFEPLELINSTMFRLDSPMFVPSNYNFLTSENDLIAIPIPKNVPTRFIVPLCFQEVSSQVGDKCWISGPAVASRQTSDGDVRSDWVFIRNCTDTVRHIPNIDQWAVCAGRDGTGSCRGDSGGPLACFNSESRLWEATGLISWAISPIPCLYGTFGTDVHTKLFNIDVWLDQINL